MNEDEYEPKPLLTVAAFVVLGDLLTITALVLAGIYYGSRNALPVKPYPLDTCLVSGKPLAQGGAYRFVHGNQEVKLCCNDCLPKFKADPTKRLARLAPLNGSEREISPPDGGERPQTTTQ